MSQNKTQKTEKKQEKQQFPQTIENQRNPILPLGVHIPDSEAHVMSDGKLYIYGSYDALEQVYCSEEYHVASTPDLKTWTVHEKSLDGNDIPWCNNPDYPHYPGIDWSHPTPFIKKMLTDYADDKAAFENPDNGPKPSLLFAPDCLERDGKYYLYFCMSDDTEGVAVSDKPEGPFTDFKQLPVGGIDPAIFIDDDGQAYYYWGQLFSHGAKLADDMVTLDVESITDNLVTEEEHFFHEGSSMRKIGGTYYYVYASIAYGKPTSLSYATSKSPLGPFTYRGVIINNQECDPASWNNHGSIECVNGQWYVFYHRCSQGDKLNRRLCIEKIQIMPDGSIPEVKMTSQGVGDPFGPGETVKGYEACGVRGGCCIGLSEEGEPYPEKLTNLKEGCEAVFRYFNAEHVYSTFSITDAGSGKITLLLNGKEAGTLNITGAADEQAGTAQTFTAQITLPEEKPEDGLYEAVLRIEESSGLELFDLTLGN